MPRTPAWARVGLTRHLVKQRDSAYVVIAKGNQPGLMGHTNITQATRRVGSQPDRRT